MNSNYRSKSGLVSLEIRDGGMSAWLTISETGSLIDEREILELIDLAGIKAGFEEAQDYIRENNLEKEFSRPFPLALCKAGSVDTKLNYYFDHSLARELSPTADPSLLARMSYVEPESVIADYSSNLFDRHGSIYNIFGEIIPNEGINLDTAKALAGEGVRFDEQLNAYVSIATGYPYLDSKGKLCLLDNLILGTEIAEYQFPLHIPVNISYEGDLENARIYCKGKILVNGNLKDSYLESENDIEVSGIVHSSEIKAAGKIRIDGDIISCAKGGINSQADISCGSILNSLVLCKGSLRFGSLASESLIVADAGITGEPGSNVMQCHMQACGSIELDNLGSPEGGSNEIEITISPYYKNLLTRMTKELIRLKEQPEFYYNELESLGIQIKSCENELDNQLNAFLKREPGNRFHIKISGRVHPHAELRILKHTYTIKSAQTSLNLEEQD